jgi:hypothetical protein
LQGRSRFEWRADEGKNGSAQPGEALKRHH